MLERYSEEQRQRIWLSLMSIASGEGDLVKFEALLNETYLEPLPKEFVSSTEIPTIERSYVDLNEDGQTLLKIAAEEDNPVIVEYLTQAKKIFLDPTIFQEYLRDQKKLLRNDKLSESIISPLAFKTLCLMYITRIQELLHLAEICKTPRNVAEYFNKHLDAINCAWSLNLPFDSEHIRMLWLVRAIDVKLRSEQQFLDYDTGVEFSDHGLELRINPDLIRGAINYGAEQLKKLFELLRELKIIFTNACGANKEIATEMNDLLGESILHINNPKIIIAAAQYLDFTPEQGEQILFAQIENQQYFIIIVLLSLLRGKLLPETIAIVKDTLLYNASPNQISQSAQYIQYDLTEILKIKNNFHYPENPFAYDLVAHELRSHANTVAGYQEMVENLLDDVSKIVPDEQARRYEMMQQLANVLQQIYAANLSTVGKLHAMLIEITHTYNRIRETTFGAPGKFIGKGSTHANTLERIIIDATKNLPPSRHGNYYIKGSNAKLELKVPTEVWETMTRIEETHPQKPKPIPPRI